jgi:hypothetical protein
MSYGKLRHWMDVWFTSRFVLYYLEIRPSLPIEYEAVWPQSRPEIFGSENNILFYPGIEPQICGCPPRLSYSVALFIRRPVYAQG